MKTQYDLEILDIGRNETIELSMVSFVTDIIESETSENQKFFSVVLQGGTQVSVISENKELLKTKRTNLLIAKDKFTKKFYKRMAKLNAKAVNDKKQQKRIKKNVKKEIALLTEIRDILIKKEQ